MLLLGTPQFSAQWRPTAVGALEVLRVLREEPQIDWTFLSPSAHLVGVVPGAR